MNRILERRLKNGVVVEVVDRSKLYYGDFHHVNVDVVCTVPVAPEHFDSEESCAKGQKLLGSSTEFRKNLARMGVPSAQVEVVRSSLIDSFMATTGTYLESPDFPRKLVQANLVKAGVKRRGFGA